MEQQQIKVSFSLQAKLLLSLVFLLVIVIFFLNISSIILFREDKRTYIYESQLTEGLLAGKEFLTTSKHALDTLRTLLVNVDPKKNYDMTQANISQSIIDNQSELISASIYIVDPKLGTRKNFFTASKVKQIADLGLSLDDYLLTADLMNLVLPEVKKNFFDFVNLSKLGSPPMLAVVTLDPNFSNQAGELVLGVGLVSLKGFGAELSHVKLTIATRSGLVLYDTDPTVIFAKSNISDTPLFKAAAESRVMNGAQEFDFNGAHWLGSYVNPGLNLVVLTTAEWHKAMRATYKLIEKFILTASMAVGAAILFSIFFSKTLTAPLASLYSATQEIGSGNFMLKLEEKGRDEFSALSSSFNTMSMKIAELIEKTKGQAKLEQELAIASTVQQTLIPKEEFLNDRIHIRSHYQSASECGGDWWGYFVVGNKICIMIADATGHGLPCALITASARSCFSFLQKLAQEDPDFTFSPSGMLPFANQVVYDASLGQIMMTFFAAVIDLDTMTLNYSSAAHNPPWLLSQSEGQVVVKSLISQGRRLGESLSIPDFEEQSLPIRPTDTIVFYTDGLLEGTNLEGKQFGKKKARQLAAEAFSGGPTQIVSSLVKEFGHFNEGKPLDDDVTIAVIRILS